MKTASTFLQILALSACFAMQAHAAGAFSMPGVRRAIQTITEQRSPAPEAFAAMADA